MKTSEILIAAKALIDTPEKWARNGNSHTAHCAIQAIVLAAPPGNTNTTIEAFRLAIRRKSVVYWNDAPRRTHADVMTAFDRAIAAEQAKEAGNV